MLGLLSRFLPRLGRHRERVSVVVPVVFLILPVTILFALYPGASYLQFSL
jgi:hypothetical protein